MTIGALLNSLILTGWLFGTGCPQGNSYRPTSYVTNPNRLPQIKKHCGEPGSPGSTTRDYLETQYLGSVHPSPSQTSDMRIAFNFSKNFIVNVYKQNWTEVNNEIYTNNMQNIVFYVGPFIIGAIILVLIMPPILYFCLFSSHRMCRKPALEPYTPLQSKFPVVISVLLCLAILTTTIVGLASESHMKRGYNEIACAAMVVYDDLVNGNATQNSTYWAGTDMVYKELISISEKSINDTLKVLEILKPDNMTQIRNILATNLHSVALVPSNSIGSPFNLTYRTPFNQTFTVYPNLNLTSKYEITNLPQRNITSEFVRQLGTADQPLSLIGSYYAVVNELNSLLNQIVGNASSFLNFSSTFNQSLTNLFANETDADKLGVYAVTLDEYISANYGNISSMRSDFVESLFYSFWLVLIILCLGSLLVMVYLQVQLFRKVLYGVCIALIVFSFLTFAAASFFSVMSPYSFYACDFFNDTVQNSTIFVSNLNQFNTTLNQSIVKTLTSCLSSGSGNFFDLIDKNITRGLSKFEQITTGALKYNGSQFLSSLNAQHNRLLTAVRKNSLNMKMDLPGVQPYLGGVTPNYVTTQQDIFKRLANNKFFLDDRAGTNGTTICKDPNFLLDSWVPYPKMENFAVICRFFSWKVVDHITGANQHGCYETDSVLSSCNDIYCVLGFLNSRYKNCSSFVYNLTNVWDNYYLVKRNAFKQMEPRLGNLNSSTGLLSDRLNATLSTPIQKLTNWFYNTNPKMAKALDPKYGLIAGMNCELMGLDLNIFVNTFCKGTFEYFNFHRSILGFLSFFSMMLICCLTCSLKRNNIELQTISAEDSPVTGRSPMTEKELKRYFQGFEEEGQLRLEPNAIPEIAPMSYNGTPVYASIPLPQ